MAKNIIRMISQKMLCLEKLFNNKNITAIGIFILIGHEHQSADTCPPSRLHVAVAVAEHDRICRSNIKFINCLKDHSGRGLSVGRFFFISADTLFGVIGTVINAVDLDPLFFKFTAHPVIKPIKIIFAVIASGYPRLICNNYQKITLFLSFAAEMENAVHKVEILGQINIATVNVNNTVTVEKYCFSHFIPQK